jgi:hypothetical protein
MKYFKGIKDILLYYDIEVLLFFWISSDILNNLSIWTTPNYWVEQGQSFTYWLYFMYLCVSIGMLISLFNIKWLIRFVFFYLSLTLFSTIRYLLDIITNETESFNWVDSKNITITVWYVVMWGFILFKLKKEKLHRDE